MWFRDVFGGHGGVPGAHALGCASFVERVKLFAET